MNMKLDYSKTINEQIDTFDYYKNRYANYELEILKLQQENHKYKEAIEKAIEYIYEHSRMQPPCYEFREFYNVSNLSELESILKEVE